jgi:hypothetical protein
MSSPNCRICNRRLGSGAVRYQMVRRAPQDVSPVAQFWLCDDHYDDVCDAMDAAHDMYYGPKETKRIKGLIHA